MPTLRSGRVLISAPAQWVDQPLSGTSCPLLRMPNEILWEIRDHVQHLTEKDENEEITESFLLYPLSLVCHRLHDLCERDMYASVTLVREEMFESFLESIVSRPNRRTYVNSLYLRDAELHDPTRGFRWGTKGLRLVQSTLFKQFQSPALPHLRCCILNIEGRYSEPWDAKHLRAVFLHPTLESLHFIFAQFKTENFQFLDAYQHSTPLRELVLDSCDISVRVWKYLLKVPRVLTCLTVDQLNSQPYDRPRLRTELVCGSSWKEDLIAILKCCPSLKKLGYTKDTVESAPQQHLDLTKFSNLDEITVPLWMIELSMKTLQLRLPQILPSNIKVINLENIAPNLGVGIALGKDHGNAIAFCENLLAELENETFPQLTEVWVHISTAHRTFNPKAALPSDFPKDLLEAYDKNDVLLMAVVALYSGEFVHVSDWSKRYKAGEFS